MALKITKENYEEILGKGMPVVIDFWAEWCGPCRMVSPIVDEIAEENPQYLVGKINVDTERELAQRFRVLSIPTLVVIKNGEVVHQSAGAKSKDDILAMLKG